MKIEWLETIIAVARCGSFSEASEVIPCAQSSVSRHVKNAENELGVTFFKRSSNSNLVELTPDGRKLLPLIEKTLNDYRDFSSQASASVVNRHIPLVLGVDSGVYSAPSKGSLISLLYLHHPEIYMTIEEIPREAQNEALTSGKIDAMFATHTILADSEIELPFKAPSIRYQILGTQSLSIAYGEKYAPNDGSGITFAHLKNERFIFHTDIREFAKESNRNARHYLFVKACRDNGFEPNIIIVDRNLADIKPLLAINGMGVYPSTIPDFLWDYPGLCFVPVTDAPHRMLYYLMYLDSSRNKGVFSFAEFMRGCFTHQLK